MKSVEDSFIMLVCTVVSLVGSDAASAWLCVWGFCASASQAAKLGEEG